MPDDFDDDRPSKTQRKRELDALKDLGARLADVPQDQLEKLSEPRLIDAVAQLRQIHRGSARKRQVQFIGKLLRDDALAAEVQAILDRLDAGSRAHAQAFHRLEQWRDRLVAGDRDVLDEIAAACPAVDRQHLRQLTRKAADEEKLRASGQSVPPTNYRKLFQYLRQLVEQGSATT